MKKVRFEKPKAILEVPNILRILTLKPLTFVLGIMYIIMYGGSKYRKTERFLNDG
jgi:hypothetical protein